MLACDTHTHTTSGLRARVFIPSLPCPHILTHIPLSPSSPLHILLLSHVPAKEEHPFVAPEFTFRAHTNWKHFILQRSPLISLQPSYPGRPSPSPDSLYQKV